MRNTPSQGYPHQIGGPTTLFDELRLAKRERDDLAAQLTAQREENEARRKADEEAWQHFTRALDEMEAAFAALAQAQAARGREQTNA